MSWRSLHLLCWGVVFAWQASVWAQDEAPKQDKSEPAATEPATEDSAASKGYAELRKEWDALNERAKKLLDESRTAEPERRQAIGKEFRDLVAEHEKVVARLTEAAVAEFKADPKKNTEAAQFVADLAGDLVRRDRYEQALELVQPLIENESDAKGLYGTAGVAAFSVNDFDAAEKYFATAQAKNQLAGEAGRYAGMVADEKEKWQREKELRDAEAKADDLPRVRMTTSKGDLVIELFENEAPNTVANFISLVEKGFYNGLTFHRVLGGFMAQGGDPTGDGTGGPGYTIECECDEPNARMHFRGSLSMAHAGKDTGGSQFFLTFRPTTHLDERHTVFGRVIEGMDVLAELTRRDPSGFGRLPAPDKIIKAEMIRKRDHEYQPEVTPEAKK